jgi:hypothetical protein
MPVRIVKCRDTWSYGSSKWTRKRCRPIGRRSRQGIENSFPEITWEHSHVTIDDDGLVRTFCVYAAPDEDTVRNHAEHLGHHQVESIHEIAGDVTPADFPG